MTLDYKSIAFNLGKQAYHDGKKASDNPFQINTKEYSEWEDGYVCAVDDD